jgi:hypothetical protein
MVRNDERDSVVLVDGTAKLSDRRFCVEKSLGSEGPERNDYFRLDELELPYQIRTAGGHFIRQRISVARRPVLEHVANENVFALEVDGGENLCQ